MIYKVESFHIFEAMLNNLNQKTLAALMRGQIYVQPAPRPMATNVSVSGAAPAAPASQQAPAQAQQPQAQAPQAPQAPAPAPKIDKAMPEHRNDYSQYTASKESLPGENAQRQAMAGASPQRKVQPMKAAPKIGRNDPCPCGSGKKYKNCHGRNA